MPLRHPATLSLCRVYSQGQPAGGHSRRKGCLRTVLSPSLHINQGPPTGRASFCRPASPMSS